MKRLDGARIRRAIDDAERGTTGHIAVRIFPGHTAHALATACEQLHAAQLHRAAQRNAVVFLVAPHVREFAAYGDEGIHRRVGDAFWKHLVDEMTPYFERGEPTDGLLHGIAAVGEQLHAHFPKPAHA